MVVRNNLKDIRMREFAENQKEFAKRLDMILGSYNQIELAKRLPSLEVALKIAAILDRQIEDIWYLEQL